VTNYQELIWVGIYTYPSVAAV